MHQKIYKKSVIGRDLLIINVNIFTIQLKGFPIYNNNY